MNIIEAAIEYKKLGWYVLPICPAGKNPLIKYKDREKIFPTEEEIKKWFLMWPDANIGIRTGQVSGVVVVDFDDINAKEKLENFLKIEIPDTIRQETSHGKKQYFFRYKNKIKSSVGIIEKVDIRGDGGIVVLPPSLHKSGSTYKWIHIDPTSDGIDDLLDIPYELEKFLTENNQKKTQKTKKEKIVSLVDGISEGERDTALFKEACSLREKGCSREEIEAAILTFSAKCKPPFPEKLALEKVAQAMKYEIKCDFEKNEGMENLQKTEKGKIKPSLGNAIIIIENDENLKDCVKYNKLNGNLICTKNFDDFKPKIDSEWDEISDIFVRLYLEKKYRIEFSPEKISAAITHVGMKKKYHPIIDYIEAQKWDGIKRVDTFFSNFLGVEKNNYILSISRIFLTAAVKRIYEPGCKFDFVPIIEGKQGIRKSTFWKILSMNFFTELQTLDFKQAAEIIKGRWFIELPELQAYSRSDIESSKAFLSKDSDRYREAYARKVTSWPRQCVFCGTTNRYDNYLRDPSGNRRIWPVRVKLDTIDTEKLEKNVSQIWAEARLIYALGENLYLTSDINLQAIEEQSNRMIEDDWTGVIAEWLQDQVGTGKEKTCIIEIWVECLKQEISKISIRERIRIKNILDHLENWERHPSTLRFSRYGHQKGYFLKKLVPF